MATRELQDLRAYAQTLHSCSEQELEDIYFHINVVHHPRRYQLVLHEMEARRLRVEEGQPPRRAPDLAVWLAQRPRLARHPALRGLLLAWLVWAVAAGATLALLAPIWLFAVPLRFIGIQASLVYLAYSPVPAVVGAGVGARLGGKRIYSLFVLLGVMAAFALFPLTGAPAAIIRTFVEPQGSGGGTLGF